MSRGKGLLVAAALFGLLGCHGKIISKTETPRTEVQDSASCTKSGWCHRCNGYGEGRHCGYGWSYSCPGHRLILKQVWTETVKYEDGYVSTYQQSAKLKNLSACR